MPLKPILIAALLALTGCASVAPRHDVPLWPEHIRAGIAPGDRVEVQRRDGDVSVVGVQSVGDTELTTDSGQRIHFDDLARLRLIGRNPPRNPCDNGAPLLCSTPRIVTLLSDFHAEYHQRFRGACALHDLCYRHGATTYGFDRTTCDARFLDDMRDSCRNLLDLDVVERLRCNAAAAQFHAAVVRYGEPRFLDAGASCQYLGPAGEFDAP